MKLARRVFKTNNASVVKFEWLRWQGIEGPYEFLGVTNLRLFFDPRDEMPRDCTTALPRWNSNADVLLFVRVGDFAT